MNVFGLVLAVFGAVVLFILLILFVLSFWFDVVFTIGQTRKKDDK